MALLRRSQDTSVATAEVSPPTLAGLLATMTGVATVAERRAAAIDLGARPEAAAGLAQALPAESSLQVRAAIVTALVAIGDEHAITGLLALVRTEDAALRNAAVQALRDIGSPARSQVETILQSPDPDRRIVAITLLEAMGDRGAIDLVRATLAQEPELNVGLAAVEALSYAGGPEDIPALRAFAARFPQHRFPCFAVDLACRRIAAEDQR